MKRILCALLAVIMMASLVPTKASAASAASDSNPPASYRAIDNNLPAPYHKEAENWAKKEGIISGSLSTSQVVNRADFVTLLWRRAGGLKHSKYRRYAANMFDDVPDRDTDYVYAVGWAVENHITAGKGNRQFCPWDSVKNSETITFLWAAVTKAGVLTANDTHAMKLQNLNCSNTYFETSCNWANDLGYLSSIPAFGNSNSFRPDDNTTQEKVIYLLWEMSTGEYDYGVAVEKMASIAEKEYDNRYYVDYTKYGTTLDWCSAFASWCAKEVGIANNTHDNTWFAYNWTVARSDTYPVLRTISAPTMMAKFMLDGNFFANSTHYYSSVWKKYMTYTYEDAVVRKLNLASRSFMPRRGDFIFFANVPNDHGNQDNIENYSGICGHVGIVVDTKKTGNITKITTIEGNSLTCGTYYCKDNTGKFYKDALCTNAYTDKFYERIVGFSRIQ